jgi:hypothetical protein
MRSALAESVRCSLLGVGGGGGRQERGSQLVGILNGEAAKTRALCFPRGCSGFRQYPVSFSRSTIALSPLGILIGIPFCL